MGWRPGKQPSHYFVQVVLEGVVKHQEQATRCFPKGATLHKLSSNQDDKSNSKVLKVLFWGCYKKHF